MTPIALLIVAFLCGSIPFSVWLGKLFLGKDVRACGDGNPGAANVFRAGARGLGVVVVILDVSKAAAPVGLAYNDFGVRGLPMVMISVAPLLGHVFCPFLRFRGGKGLATALGIWIGLTIWKASLAGVLATLLGIADDEPRVGGDARPHGDPDDTARLAARPALPRGMGGGHRHPRLDAPG